MAVKNTGGPAYPCEHDRETGMTLREKHADTAMRALLSQEGINSYVVATSSPAAVSTRIDKIAKLAYQMADAMIAEGAR